MCRDGLLGYGEHFFLDLFCSVLLGWEVRGWVECFDWIGLGLAALGLVYVDGLSWLGLGWAARIGE